MFFVASWKTCLQSRNWNSIGMEWLVKSAMSKTFFHSPVWLHKKIIITLRYVIYWKPQDKKREESDSNAKSKDSVDFCTDGLHRLLQKLSRTFVDNDLGIWTRFYCWEFENTVVELFAMLSALYIAILHIWLFLF